MAVIKKNEPSSIFSSEPGYVQYSLESRLHFAKLIKSDYHYKRFKLIPSGLIVSENYNYAKRGDRFCYSCEGYNYLLEKPRVFVTQKTLLRELDEIHNDEEVKKNLGRDL